MAIEKHLSLGHEAVEGWHRGAQRFGVSVGVTSLIVGTAGGAAPAQAQQQLPSVQVTATKAKAKAKSKRRARPAQPQQAAPLPAPVVQAPVPPGGIGTGLTPASGNTLQAGTGMGRVPGTVQDIPQVVNVVPKAVLEQQNVQSLEQALRNVPGVTLAIGEGGTPNGDQFRIRGIQAKADLYTDGLRDFGIFTRDSFNYESVQVLKGPSSGTFGQGTGGGAINTQTKAPRLENFTEIDVTGGTGPLARTTIDTNQRINSTTAVRINGMYHNQDNPDRDLIESERWGLAAALGFGLGTRTEFTLSYFHQNDERRPDYGVTFVTRPGATIAKPITEYGVSRSTFYGFKTDHDDTQVDALTARFRHVFSPNFILYNDTRLTGYKRDFEATAPSSCSGACSVNFFNGVTSQTTNRGGPSPYKLDGWGLQNVLTTVGKFHTGFLRHELVTGMDAYTEHTERKAFAFSPGRPPANLLNPSHDYDGVRNPNGHRDGQADNFGLFISDRVWLMPQLSIVGGVRWDNHSASSTNVSGAGVVTENNSDANLVNPRAGVIWEPTKDQTYYFSWAKASSPQGAYISGESAGNENLDPEETETYEIGAKISLFRGMLGLTGAIFQVEKDNAVAIDPLTGTIITDSRERADRYRIRGFEIGVNGKLARDWSIAAGYTYLDTEILHNGVDGVNAGNKMYIVPRNSASLWLTHDASSWILPYGMRGKVLIGTGLRYQEKMFVNAANTAEVPSSFTWDGLLSYEIDKWKVSLNGYNLTDELNYDQVWSNRAVPSLGRTVTLTTSVKF
ncbi:MAG: TonB-dependent receptor [Hyphomicrobiaceae bacterium]